MGFNTLALILNDYSHSFEKSPKTIVHMLAYPPLSEHERDWTEENNIRAAQANGEIAPQGITVLPTFHADNHNYYLAGGNTCVKLAVVKYGKTKEGKRTVTLEIPDWG